MFNPGTGANNHAKTATRVTHILTTMSAVSTVALRLFVFVGSS